MTRRRRIITADQLQFLMLFQKIAEKFVSRYFNDFYDDYTDLISSDTCSWSFNYSMPTCHALHQVAGVADIVLYNVHTFLHQSPNSVVGRASGSTGLFGGHRSGEIKSGVSC